MRYRIIPSAGMPNQCACHELRTSPLKIQDIEWPKQQQGHQVMHIAFKGQRLKCTFPAGSVMAKAMSAVSQNASSKYFEKNLIVDFTFAGLMPVHQQQRYGQRGQNAYKQRGKNTPRKIGPVYPLGVDIIDINDPNENNENTGNDQYFKAMNKPFQKVHFALHLVKCITLNTKIQACNGNEHRYKFDWRNLWTVERDMHQAHNKKPDAAKHPDDQSRNNCVFHSLLL